MSEYTLDVNSTFPVDVPFTTRTADASGDFLLLGATVTLDGDSAPVPSSTWFNLTTTIPDPPGGGGGFS